MHILYQYCADFSLQVNRERTDVYSYRILTLVRMTLSLNSRCIAHVESMNRVENALSNQLEKWEKVE